MEYINKVELLGKVGFSACAQVGDKYHVSFSLSTCRAYHAADGQAVVETTWHNVNLITEHRDFADQLRPGTNVHVLGRLREHHYTDAVGVIHISWEVCANSVDIVNEENEEFLL